MNGNFDGGRGMYGLVLLGAFAELGRYLNRPGQARRETGRSWKRVMFVLGMIATPVVLLLASGNGF